MIDDLARVRVVPPSGGRPRLCDVEVSSDGGETWAPLPTQGVTLDSALDELAVVTLSIPAIPGIVEVELAGPSKVEA